MGASVLLTYKWAQEGVPPRIVGGEVLGSVWYTAPLMVIIKIEWALCSSRKFLAGNKFLRRALEPWTEGWEERGEGRLAGPQGHISVPALDHSL